MLEPSGETLSGVRRLTWGSRAPKRGKYIFPPPRTKGPGCVIQSRSASDLLCGHHFGFLWWSFQDIFLSYRVSNGKPRLCRHRWRRGGMGYTSGVIRGGDHLASCVLVHHHGNHHTIYRCVIVGGVSCMMHVLLELTGEYWHVFAHVQKKNKRAEGESPKALSFVKFTQWHVRLYVALTRPLEKAFSFF